MKTSAGCLVRRASAGGELFLLVHPSGNYNRRAPWSIPKGELDPGEDAAACALRETREETGLECRILGPLGEVTYPSKQKKVVGFLAEPLAPIEELKLTPASWEVDQVEFVGADEARRRIHPAQAAFIDRALRPPDADSSPHARD